MGSDSHAVAGGPARHIPVLGRSAVEWLGVRDGGLYVDATFGAGGYTQAILATPGARVIGIDRDQSAIARGFSLVEAAQGRLDLVEDRFSNLEAIVGGTSAVDGIVFDVGVSSMQIDDAARGFSFRLDGPLDMRMGGDGPSAADIVARASERDLGFIIATLGEERHARAVARAIVKARGERAIDYDASAGRDRRACRAFARQRHSSGDAHVPGRCGFSSTTSLANWRAASPRPNGRSNRPDAWSWSPSIRSKIASSKPSLPSAAARRPARGIGRNWYPPRRVSAC